MQVQLSKVRHEYASVAGEVVIPLKDIDFTVNPGDTVTLLGPSGSGKSTLLFILGCMLKPSQGEVTIDGKVLSQLGESELAQYRLHKIGFILQQSVLLPTLTVWENVMLPLWIEGKAKFNQKQARQKVKGLLEEAGLLERAQFLPHQLSGGQRRRVAIARAFVHDPELILADEPTAELDQANREIICKWLFAQAKKGTAVVIATHDAYLANLAGRVYFLDHGYLSLPLHSAPMKLAGKA